MVWQFLTRVKVQMKRYTLSPLFLLQILLLLPLSLLAQPDETYGIGEREILGGGVNTASAELVPRLNDDGTRLYFVRKEAPTNVGGVADQDDIYYSDLGADGTWGEAVNIGPPLNTPGSDVLFWISEDEKTALLYHGKKINGVERGLSIARKTRGTWGEPKAISIKGVSSLGNWYYASISPDRQYLMLAYSPDPKQEFNLDLFFARPLSDDLTSWDTPVPINGLNSPFIEASPWLSKDGRTLYFISDRPDGLGLADVFASHRPAEEWIWWSPPESIGYSINSPSFEADVSLSNDERWIFTSKSASLEPQSVGRTDIYRHTMPEKMGSMFVSPLRGRLVDDETGDPIEGTVKISIQRQGVEVGTLTTDSDGWFNTIVMPGHLMTFAGRADGYAEGGSTFDGRFLNAGEQAKDVFIRMKRGGEIISTTTTASRPETTTVLFATGGAALSAGAERTIRRFVSAWKRSGEGRVQVHGYTDSVGTETDNIELSLERATAVAALLKRLGVPSSVITTEGHGERDPSGDNGTSAGRRENRRVDLRVE